MKQKKTRKGLKRVPFRVLNFLGSVNVLNFSISETFNLSTILI